MMKRMMLVSILVFLMSGVVSADLSDALDTTLIFTTGGDVDWFTRTAIYYYDGDAAQSGGITNGQESWMQTTVSRYNATHQENQY